MAQIKLEDLNTSIKRQMEKVLNKTTEYTVELMKDIAPVDTGELKESIGSNTTSSDITVGPTVDYAPFVALGTERQQPNPFVQSTASSMDAIIERAIKDT